MSKLNELQVDTIVQSCLDLYSKLPKTGKPVEKEWTVVSCVVQYDKSSGEHAAVSLGSGCKCVGAARLAAAGDVLHDSHAEVVARRAFLLYLYDNIQWAIDNKTSIFTKENHKFVLKENIQFIFYSSQLPCGDASIIPKCGEEEQFGDVVTPAKRKAVDDICDSRSKLTKVEDDIHRTGAKCLTDAEQDPKLVGADYHLLGQVRTKPGRGDQTLSVSCSDKLARWVQVGVQGALLDMLCHPIYISHFIFGKCVPYSEESLNRALLERDKTNSVQLEYTPVFYQSSLSFCHLRTEDRLRPAPGSIVWTASRQITEVAVQGRKLGLTKKMTVLPKYSLCISKYKLYERFKSIVNSSEELRKGLFGESSIENVGYNEMKRKSIKYVERWLDVRERFFRMWTVKPDLWDFQVSAVDCSLDTGVRH